MSESSAPPEIGSPPRKRRKARRACDPCRARKLRCEYPEESPERCTACIKAGVGCDSTQPAKIDKRRLRALVDLATTEEQRQWVTQQIAQRGVYVASTDKGALRKARPSAAGDPLQLMARLSGPLGSTSPASPTPPVVRMQDDPGPSRPLTRPSSPTRSPERQPEPVSVTDPTRPSSAGSPTLKTTGLEPRLQGPTASINLLGDLPEGSAAVAKHDRRYGLFRVTDDWVFGGNTDEPMREGHLASQQLKEDVVAKLIGFYTAQIAPINPVIPPHRVTSAVKSAPVVLASVVAVAALSRDVPSEIYANVRHRLKLQLVDQVGGGSTFPQIQAMLVSGMSHELHGDTNMEGGSNCWLRIGSAIRQAQDIGLHRLDSRHWLPEMFADRVRAWLGCIIVDRWYGGAYGQPLTINLLDCEDPLANEDLLQTPDLSHAFQTELFHVSCLLGDIMQTIYRPRGLEQCTDQKLEAILAAIDNRIAIIDNTVAFLRNTSSLQAGLLNLTISCTEIIFFRSFVKLNRKLPPQLSFRPSATRWLAAVRRAQTAISWTDVHGDVLLDCWLVVKWAITYCALAQYYHFAAERDTESLHSLSIAKNVMNRWALGHRQNRPIAARSKIADIVNIFYKAALELSRDESAHPLSQPPFAPDRVQPPNNLDSRDHPNHAGIVQSAEPALDAANTLLNMDGNRPPSAGRAGPRFDPSTLDDWLADVFRLHGDGDVGYMASANDNRPAEWPEGTAYPAQHSNQR